MVLISKIKELLKYSYLNPNRKALLKREAIKARLLVMKNQNNRGNK